MMAGGRFDRATFRDSNLAGANLSGGTFMGADFRDATLRRTNLAGADLSKAVGLDQDQLDSACGDASTRLPPGLEVRPCNRAAVHFTGMTTPSRAPRVLPAMPQPPAPPAAPRYLVAADD